MFVPRLISIHFANVLSQKDGKGDRKESRLAIRIKLQMYFAPIYYINMKPEAEP